jgi:hypothetical protein
VLAQRRRRPAVERSPKPRHTCALVRQSGWLSANVIGFISRASPLALRMMSCGDEMVGRRLMQVSRWRVGFEGRLGSGRWLACAMEKSMMNSGCQTNTD